MAKKIGLEVEIKSDSVGEAVVKTDSLKKQLQDLKKELASGTLKGEAFEEAAAKAGKMQKEIEKVNKVVNQLSKDNKLDAFISTTEGLAGGFAAAQGAAALFGTENEDLQKTFVKLQAAMSILNGVQAINSVLKKESALNTILLSKANVIATTSTNGLSTATKGFSKALIATGIGAIVVAIGLLIANFDKLKGAISGVSVEQKNLIEGGEKRLAQSEKELDAISLQENILKLQGKSQLEIIRLKQEALKETIKEAEALLISQENIKETQIQAAERNQNILKGILNFLTMPLQLLIDYANKAAKLLGFEGFDFNIGKEIAKRVFDVEAVTQEANDTIEVAREKLNQLKNEQAGFQLAVNDINKKAAEEAEKIRLAALQKLEDDAKKRMEIRNKEMEDLQTSVDKEIAETRRLEEEKEKIRKDAWEANAKGLDKYIADQQKAAAAEMQLKRDLEQDTIRGLVAISNLFEQGSAGQKAFALASIAADTAVAIGGALRNSQAPTGDNMLTGGLAGVAKFAAIAVSILSGAAQAKSVLQGGSVSSFGSGQVQTSVNIPNPPQMQDPRGIRVQQNSRVFVLESDISRTQRRVNVIEQNAIVD